MARWRRPQQPAVGAQSGRKRGRRRPHQPPYPPPLTPRAMSSSRSGAYFHPPPPPTPVPPAAVAPTPPPAVLFLPVDVASRCPFYLTTLWLQSVPSHTPDAEPSSGNAGSGTLSPDWPRSRAGRLQLAVAQVLLSALPPSEIRTHWLDDSRHQPMIKRCGRRRRPCCICVSDEFYGVFILQTTGSFFLSNQVLAMYWKFLNLFFFPERVPKYT